jgi:hypothetical protein
MVVDAVVVDVVIQVMKVANWVFGMFQSAKCAYWFGVNQWCGIECQVVIVFYDWDPSITW